MIALHGDLQEERIGHLWERIGHLWCCDVVHRINTECLQCGNTEVLECISHQSHIEYIVQLVVFTPCLDIESLPQLHHVIILVLGHHLSLHIIDALLTRRNDGIVQCVVRFDEIVEHGFFPCQQIDVLVTPLLAS